MASAALNTVSAAELSIRLEAGEVSSVEVTQAHLDRIAAVDGDVHAFLHVSDELAIAQKETLSAPRRKYVAAVTASLGAGRSRLRSRP